ncbi:three component ABC system middle component [Kitasatospora sp. NPDC048407]|uniref:three component ABC system middle component n=1 Tax=Kitasatospora sp. NPDC048407 TaxID=3364051 RepID=UPI00370F84C5
MAGLELSREERALFNPAFTALVCARAVQGHAKQYQRPCPLPVAMTATVMSLQPTIRKALPATIRNGLMTWLNEHEAVRVAMSRNAAPLAAVVRPGILFALQTEILRLDGPALTLTPRAVGPIAEGDTEQNTAIQSAAHLLGRWLPSTGSISTVLTLLGVQL